MYKISGPVTLISAQPVVNVSNLTRCITFKSWSAVAPVVVHLIKTCAIVLTGSRGTLVDVQVTVVALKSRHTETLVGVDPVFTDGSILAGLRLALVNVLLTVRPLVPSSTLAPVPNVMDIYTRATILACLL